VTWTLLYALLRDPVATRTCAPAGPVQELKPTWSSPPGSQPSCPTDSIDPEQDRAFQRVLERAAMQVQSSARRHRRRSSGGLFRERFPSLYLLEKQGVTRRLLRSSATGAQGRTTRPAPPCGSDTSCTRQPQGDDEDAAGDDPLAAYCVDLVQRRGRGTHRPLVAQNSWSGR